MRKTGWLVAGSLLLASANATAEQSDAEAQEGTVGIGVDSGNASAMAQQASEIRQAATQTATRIQKMLDEARQKGDIIMVTCLDQKLTQVNTTKREVDRRSGAMAAAESLGKGNEAKHEFMVLSVLSEKLGVLSQEAQQCVGQDAFDPGAAQVVVTTPAMPDPISMPSTPPAPPPAVAIPPAMSPTM